MPGSDQSNELSTLDADDESVSPDSSQYIWRDWLYNQNTWSFGAWIIHSCTLQKYKAATTISIILDQIQILATLQWSLALLQYEKCYTSCPVGAMSS